MKIKTVESLLKQTKFITLYDDDRCQWVSNGHACYPLRNMPLLDADSIFTMLDVPEDKKDKYIFRRDKLSATTLDFSDNVVGERVFDRDLLALSMGGKEIEALRSHGGGIIFFDTSFLRPFADEESVELYERHTRDGKSYIAVKTGLLLIGVILPIRVINESFIEMLSDMTNLSVYARMKARKISKMMSPKTMGRVFADKLEDAIANEEYPLIWEIYGEIYAARSGREN